MNTCDCIVIAHTQSAFVRILNMETDLATETVSIEFNLVCRGDRTLLIGERTFPMNLQFNDMEDFENSLWSGELYDVYPDAPVTLADRVPTRTTGEPEDRRYQKFSVAA